MEISETVEQMHKIIRHDITNNKQDTRRMEVLHSSKDESNSKSSTSDSKQEAHRT